MGGKEPEFVDELKENLTRANRNGVITMVSVLAVAALSGIPLVDSTEENDVERTVASTETIHVEGNIPYLSGLDLPEGYEQIEEGLNQEYNLPANLLKGMLIASHDHPNPSDIPEEYRGLIIMDPVTAGVSREVLDSDQILQIECAARAYHRIREETENPSIAVATFYAGKSSVNRAISNESSRLSELRYRGSGYERIYSMWEASELNDTPLDWTTQLLHWQQSAIEITLRYVEK